MRSVFFGSGAPSDEQRPSDYLIPTPLGAEELRVLGCLLEKQFLTPDVYPLTVNSLLNACNQKTSRDPVVTYDEEICISTLDLLKHKGLVLSVTGGDHRVPKYREAMSERANLRVSEIGVLCPMMLRGPQTLAELKERSQRIHEFASLEDVEAALDRLAARDPQPLVVKLPKLAGHKEVRYMHLLAGPVSTEELASAVPGARRPPQDDRVGRLEAEITALRERVEHLERELMQFRKQFE